MVSGSWRQIPLTYIAILALSRPLFAQPECRPELIGTFGGSIGTFVVADDVVYAAYASSIFYFDIADPGSPTLIGTLDLDHTRLALDGATLLVGAERTLFLFDVSNPRAPAQVGRLDRAAFLGHLAASDGVAIVGTPTGFDLINIGDPGKPRIVGSVDLGRAPPRIAKSGDLAAIGNEIWDISDPSEPQELLEIHPYPPRELAIEFLSSDVVLAASETDVTFYSIASAPVVIELGRYPINWVRHPHVDDNLVYLPHRRASRGHIAVLDASDPTMPELVAEISVPDLASTRGIRVREGLLLAPDTASRIHLLDISTLSMPVGLGRCPSLGFIERLALTGDHAIVTGRGTSIVDVGNPSSPVLLANVDDIDGPVGVRDQFAYVADAGELHVLDLADPTDPIVLPSVMGPANPWSLLVEGDLLCIGSYSGEIILLDISNRASPSQVGALTIGGYGVEVVQMTRDLVYALAGGFLHIVDISDPGAPMTLSELDTGPHAVVAVDGPVAYVADPYDFTGVYFTFFSTVDVSDPSTPTQLGATLFTHELPRSVTIANGRAFVGSTIVNVSRPSSPYVEGRWQASPAHILEHRGLLFIAGAGLVTYDLSGCPETCFADCDGSRALDVFDFLCFQDAFLAGDPFACECDTSSGAWVCDLMDFVCFQEAFAAGCP